MTASRLNRRQFLQGCSAGIAALAGSRLTGFGLAAPHLADDPHRDTLLVVFLRGG